jgi:nucleotidyltransferase substrate binding protein (TIGR01987 family)
MNQIIIEPLEKAVARLDEALKLPVDDIVRDASVQRFEYCFELSLKLIKRFLKEVYTEEGEIYLDIIKKAQKVGLVGNADLWKQFKLARNYSSHNYSESGANYSYTQAELFLPEIQLTLSKMQEINQKITEHEE